MFIAILGAGGHAREVYHLLLGASASISGGMGQVCFVDETLKKDGVLFGRPVYKEVPHAVKIFVCGVGSPALKKTFDERFNRFKTVLAPGVLIPNLKDVNHILKNGIVIGLGTKITADVTIGRLTSINSRCVISHGCRIGNYCHLSGGSVLSGDVILEDEVYVGAGGIGATFLPKVKVGEGAVIGAGAVVTEDVPERAVIVGVPGKVQRILQEGESFRL